MNLLSPETWLWILFILVGLLLIAYVISLITGKASVVSSTWQGANVISASHVYYLPTASLTVKATAKVVVEKDATGNITKATLAEVAFEPFVQTVPDTGNAFALNHNPSPFSADNFTFSINASGLLEGINLMAEDRLANIIAQVAEAPKLIMAGDQAASGTGAGAEEAGAVTTETKEYTNNFFILTGEIRAKTASRQWIINVDGTANGATTVDASFMLKFVHVAAGPPPFAAENRYDGIVSRPLHTVVMELYKTGNNTGQPDVACQLVLPDESRIIAVPVKRSAFVKKVYGLKLTNGLLTENVMNKPSEIEGFVSIPINIAKAIASIPAQLFRFRIEKINRETTLETTRQNLLKAQLERRKEQAGFDAALAKANTEAQKTTLAFGSEIAKTKLEAEKGLLEAQKGLLEAKLALEEARKKLEEKSKTPGA